MSRVFWVAVGAAGGIMVYRKGTQAAHRARELGPLGTAQAVAHATGRAATGAARGLGRLNDLQARRTGRLVVGSAQDVTPVTGAPGPVTAQVPAGWVPAGSPPPGGHPGASHPGANHAGGSPPGASQPAPGQPAPGQPSRSGEALR
jgi:hypothetical protein